MPESNGNGWKIPAWFIGIIGATVSLIILLFALFKDRQDVIDRITTNATNTAVVDARVLQLREDMNRELHSINFRLCRIEASGKIALYETCSEFRTISPTSALTPQ